ncbi:NAD(P)-binding protein [Streptomyces sp. NPDC018947]|uniref:NAD(P)-binding protein n=1 Tax=Streptomyces sp. NPDC018947 TaxID=3365054 RepID=UPI00378BF124
MTRTAPGRTDHAGVVGPGLAGLSAAPHPPGPGRRVTVVARGARPGGRLGRREPGACRLDTGPTVVTVPHLAYEAFAAVGEGLRDRVEPLPPQPARRARRADGGTLDVHTDAAATEAGSGCRTTPGAGVPGARIPGKHAAARVTGAPARKGRR